MIDNEIPEDLAPRERHWALGADFIAATVTLLACVGAIVWLALR